MKTLDSFRGFKCHKPREITKEQKQFMTRSREHAIPVTYKKMAELWTKVGWGKMNASTMRHYWLRDVKGQ